MAARQQKKPPDLMHFLGNPTNRAILSTLALEPQYPRRLAALVGLTENEVSRRLRVLEQLGIVASDWVHEGKTVKVYRVASARISIEVTPAGLRVAGDGEPIEVGPTAEETPQITRFVGRKADLANLESSLRARPAVCIHGMGGIGKTTFLAAATRRLARPVVWHTVASGESAMVALHRIAAGLRAHAGEADARRMLALLAGDDGHLLLDAVVTAAERSKALIVLDRCEGASRSLEDLVNELARRIVKAKIVMTARRFPAGVSRELVAAMRLGGLDRNDFSALLGELDLAQDARFADEVYERTRGHPLSVVLLSTVAKEDRERSVERLMEEAGIRDFLMEDVLPQLDAPERELLLALAVLRISFTVEDAVEISGDRHAGTHLIRLERRGLATRSGDGFRLHDLVRALPPESTPSSRRVHLRAGRVLVASQEAAKVLEGLYHFLEAATFPEAEPIILQEVRGRLYRFCDLGLTDAYRDVLGRFLAEAPIGAGIRWLAELELGAMDTFVGDAASARIHLDRARGLLPEDTSDAALLAAEARLLHLEGRPGDAAFAYQRALERPEVVDDPSGHLDVLLAYAFLLEEGDAAAASTQYRQAIKLGLQTSDLRQLCLAHAGAARVGFRLREDDAREQAEEALRLAKLAGYVRGEAAVYMSLTVLYMSGGDVALGRTHCQEYLEAATRLGDPYLTLCALNGLALLELMEGETEQCLATVARILDLEVATTSPYYRLFAAVTGAEAHIAAGRPTEALAMVVPALAALGPGIPAWPEQVARAWAAVAAAERMRGDEDAAGQALARAEAAAQPGTLVVAAEGTPQGAGAR